MLVGHEPLLFSVLLFARGHNLERDHRSEQSTYTLLFSVLLCARGHNLKRDHRSEQTTYTCERV